jgi:hypothetical protein
MKAHFIKNKKTVKMPKYIEFIFQMLSYPFYISNVVVFFFLEKETRLLKLQINL